MDNQSVAGSSATAAIATDQALVPVTNGTHDVAKTVGLEQMRTEAAGRVPFQQVYLWTTSEDNQSGTGKKKATTEKYDIAKDGATHGVPSKLPNEKELTPHIQAKAYLEVGLIIGGQPDKYKATSLSRNKNREERKKRGILPCDEGAMRVFIPISDYIPSQAKFYVGCRETDGRLIPCVIEVEHIFFYPEFWTGIDESKPSKERLTALTTTCKYHSASNKTKAERFQAPITSDELEKLAARHPLAVSRSEHLCSLLVLLRSLNKTTKDIDQLQTMIQVMDNAGSGFRYGQHTGTAGVLTFFNFDTPLSAEDAAQLATQFKV